MLYVRSVLASNTASSVRPSNCDCYVQLDIWKEDLFKKETWPDTIRLMKKNVLFDSMGEVGTDVYAAVPFKGIFDSFVCLENLEVSKSTFSLEDGRSRRYFVDTGYYASMISLETSLLHIPIAIERLNSDDRFGIFRFDLRRLVKVGSMYYEMQVTFLGGKFHANYVDIKVAEYTDAIRHFMLIAEVIRNESKETGKRAKGDEYGSFQIVLLGLDHSAKIDAFDVDSFLNRYGKIWNMPPKDSMFSDPISQSGWLGIHGWVSNDVRLNVDIVMHDYDDHSPAMYYLRGPIYEVSPVLERKYLAKYFLNKKINLSTKYMKHDGTKMSETEYQIWRRTNAIKW